MSWPSGLLIETVKKRSRPVYIRQTYISQGPECEDIEGEMRRCFVNDGTVIKMMRRYNRVCVLSPNGAVLTSMAYDPPFEQSQEPSGDSAETLIVSESPRLPGTGKSPSNTSNKKIWHSSFGVASGAQDRGSHTVGSTSTGKTTPNPAGPSNPTRHRQRQDASPSHNSPHNSLQPQPQRRVVEMETVQPDGQRWEVRLGDGDAPATWTPTGMYIVRTHTDYEVMETLKRRGDGSVALFKPNGDLIVSFPDGTRISSLLPQQQPDSVKQPADSERSSTAFASPRGNLSSTNQSLAQLKTSSYMKTPGSLAKMSAEGNERGTTKTKSQAAPELRQSTHSYAGNVSSLQEVSPLIEAHWRPAARVIPAMQIYPLVSDTSIRNDRLAGGGENKLKGKREKHADEQASKKKPSKTDEEIEKEKAQFMWQAAVEAAEEATRTAILANSPNSPNVFEDFEVVHLTYRMEHRNYATVEFDESSGIVNLEVPDASVCVFPDGTYLVTMQGGPHDMGDTSVTLEVAADDIVMERRLKDSGELLCSTVVNTARLGDPPGEVLDQVLSYTTDVAGRSFEVLHSGDTVYRQRGPCEHLVYSDEPRYFLVHRDLTGLELFTADALRKLVALTREDRRSIYLSQVVVKRPELSYHVSLRPLRSESTRWLMPVSAVRLSSEENRPRAGLVGKSRPARPRRSTYGLPPSWFHPFPRVRANRRLLARGDGRGSYCDEDDDDDDSDGDGGGDGQRGEAHPGMLVPDPLLVDLLKEMVPVRLRLRRIVRSAVKAITLDSMDTAEALGSIFSGDSASVLSGVEQRRMPVSRVMSTVRPEWQEKTTSTAALYLYRLATQRRTSISMSVSEENLFQLETAMSGVKRGRGSRRRDNEAKLAQELRALLRQGQGPPYFETPQGAKFLEEEAARAAEGGGPPPQEEEEEEARALVTFAEAAGGQSQTSIDVEQTTSMIPVSSPPIALQTAPTSTSAPATTSAPSPSPPPPSPKTSFTSTISFSSSTSQAELESTKEECKTCGNECPHTRRECRGDTFYLRDTLSSDLSTYFPQHRPQ